MFDEEEMRLLQDLHENGDLQELIKSFEENKKLKEEMKLIELNMEEMKQANYSLTHRLKELSSKEQDHDRSWCFKDQKRVEEDHEEMIRKMKSNHFDQMEQLRSENLQLQEREIEKDKKIEDLEMNIKKLKEEIESLQMIQPNSPIDDSIVTSQTHANEEKLKERLDEMKTKMLEQESVISSQLMQIVQLEKNLKNLEEAKASLDDLNKFYSNKIETNKNEVADLQSTIDELQLQISCGSRQGNSLFAEVDERRIEVEAKLRKNEDQLTKLKKEVVNLKNAISRQRVTIFQLTQEQNDETQQQRINSLGKEVFQALRDNQKLAEINKQLNEQLLCKVGLYEKIFLVIFMFM